MFHTIVSIKNDGHYFCRAGGNRPDGLNEPVTDKRNTDVINHLQKVHQSVTAISVPATCSLHAPVLPDIRQTSRHRPDTPLPAFIFSTTPAPSSVTR
ncbi:hypothetical protein C0905_002836 [Salmonella enterica subsp. enterica serovar Anatum]|nr:hypothetical protein [Salmonella enterica]EDS5255412.1 hypothetical protein [Salmonella enterica subsp. enterica serovar Anatum]